MSLLTHQWRLRGHAAAFAYKLPVSYATARPLCTAAGLRRAAPSPSQLAQQLRQLKQFKVWDAAHRDAGIAATQGRGRLAAAAGVPADAGDRPFGAAGRRPGILWFRGDLRLHDHEALTKCTSECTSVLPVYCFDPRGYGRGASGYERTGPYLATFQLQAVADLRRRLREAGSELVVRLGKPEEVLPALLAKIGPGTPGAPTRVYCHSGITFEELQVEARVKEGVERAGGQLAALWSNTLHTIQDLPFPLDQLPQTFERFRELTAGVAPRPALPAHEQLRGLPLAPGRLDPGQLPSLTDLGLTPLPQGSLAAATAEAAAPVGGESEALRRLQAFMADARAGRGACSSNFAGGIAPWLATGCLSPRLMLAEARSRLAPAAHSAAGTAGRGKDSSAAKHGHDGSNALEWVQFELLWRDFFRFMTRRWSLKKLPHSCATVNASTQCAPALAACA